MHMIDGLKLGVLLQSDRIEAGLLTRNLECCLEPREVFEGRTGTNVLILVEQGHANAILDRYHRIIEITFIPGVRGTPLALNGICVNVFARETVLGGNKVSADSLRHEIGFIGERGVGMHGT